VSRRSAAKSTTGAGAAGAGTLRLIAIGLGQHLEEVWTSAERLVRSPLATAMTVAVIAIALALPAGLYLLTRNLGDLGMSWGETTSISLFLTPESDAARAQAVAGRLRAHPRLARVTVVTPEAGLRELGSHSGFGDAIAELETNPLPFVLALQPAPDLVAPAALQGLARELEALPEADFVRVDTQWILRFRAILEIAERGVFALGGGLALAVLLVVGNTIRLEINNRRDEIEIMELVGATTAFIRRPFLYTGGWYGLLGGAGAWLMVETALVLVQGPVTRLAALYHTEFPLTGLGPTSSLSLLAGSLCLGLLGSWLAVGRHLAATEPR